MTPEAENSSDDAQAPASAKAWQERIIEYRHTIEDKWKLQRDNLDKLYSRDERADNADREYSIFWANIEVLGPAVYARTPVPVVAPRFKDGDLLAREASDALERCLVTTFEQAEIDGCMREVRDELLRYARGTAWVRLGKDHNGLPQVEFDHVSADDFAHGCGRSWREVYWVARRAWMTRKEGEDRFGEVFADVPVKRRDPDAAVDSPDDKAPVWEIWDRKTRKVYFIAEECADILDTQEPWLDLTSFWPCPRPAYSTKVPKKLKPVPDIRHYKDQIEEINEYTARIAALSESLRMKGFYPSGAGDLSEAIEAAVRSVDNNAVLVPVSSIAGLGGNSLKDSIVWLPVADVLKLVQGLVELRRVVIEDVYQITGISDIVRGQTEASETATAQQIKSQWGSLRIRERQSELARFARDLTRIAAEIIAENFPPELIGEMAQVQLPSAQEKMQAQAIMQRAQMAEQMAQQQPQAQPGMPAPMAPQVQPPSPDEMKQAKDVLKQPSFEDVMGFLQNDRARGFIIEIETDSTIQPDEDAEKQRRMEFVTAVGGLFQQAAPIVMQAPQLGPFMGEVLKFAADGFRAGRPLSAAIDQLTEMLQGMAEKAMEPKPPQPDPEMVKAQADVQAKQADLQIKEKQLQLKAQEMQMKMELERQKAEQEAMLAQQQAQLERDIAQFKAQTDAQVKQQQVEQDVQLAAQEHESRMAMEAQGFDAEQEMARERHEREIALAAKTPKGDD